MSRWPGVLLVLCFAAGAGAVGWSLGYDYAWRSPGQDHWRLECFTPNARISTRRENLEHGETSLYDCYDPLDSSPYRQGRLIW